MDIRDLLQQSDLRHLRFGFYKLVYIHPTQFCPASCRHCSARSSPGTQHTAVVEKLEKWVSSVTSIPGLEWIGVEGGEPFAAPAQLDTILRIAQEQGVQRSVLTNAYWAKDERRARNVLGKYPKINFLIISSDEFHDEFISLSRVVAALRAAQGMVDRLGVQMCVGPGYPAFREKFDQMVDDDLLEEIEIIETPLQYIGRAAETQIMERPDAVNTLPDSICQFLGTPVLREDGTLVACCQQDAVLDSQPNLYQLGNLDQNDAQELLSIVDEDIYFQTLRVFGPKKIAVSAIESGWDWEPKAYQRGNMCELCMHLASNQQVVDRFRGEFDTLEYRKALALGRSILFDEQMTEDVLEPALV